MLLALICIAASIEYLVNEIKRLDAVGCAVLLIRLHQRIGGYAVRYGVVRADQFNGAHDDHERYQRNVADDFPGVGGACRFVHIISWIDHFPSAEFARALKIERMNLTRMTMQRAKSPRLKPQQFYEAAITAQKS